MSCTQLRNELQKTVGICARFRMLAETMSDPLVTYRYNRSVLQHFATAVDEQVEERITLVCQYGGQTDHSRVEEVIQINRVPSYPSPERVRHNFHASIAPVCVRERSLVQSVAVQAPLGHQVVQKVSKTLVVSSLDQMGQFVNHDVFGTHRVFLRQLQI